MLIGCGVGGKTETGFRLLEMTGQYHNVNGAANPVLCWTHRRPHILVTTRILRAIWGASVLTVTRLAYHPDVLEELDELRDAHGAIFLVDSQMARWNANKEAVSILQRCFEKIGRSERTFPFVFQLNKRDLPNILTLQEMKRKLSWPLYRLVPTNALTSEGVTDILNSLLDVILT